MVRTIWGVLRDAEAHVQERFPQLADERYPNLPQEIAFLHAEDILARYPDLLRKERETAILQEHPAVFIIGIGWPLADGLPHELRAADYDDWTTGTLSEDGRAMHGLNGDILVWNPVTRRRHELSSMGIRVDAEALRRQLEMTGQQEWLRLPYHHGIVTGTLPLSIGGGIGQSRTQMLLLRKAHLGEVSVSVWPAVLKGDVRAQEHPRDRVIVGSSQQEARALAGFQLPADDRRQNADRGASGSVVVLGAPRQAVDDVDNSLHPGHQLHEEPG
jgi:aspartate--ammonia ligase